MPEDDDRPIPESQSTKDRTNQSEKGPDDKSGTKSMHSVPPDCEAGQGNREDDFNSDTMRSTENKGSNA
jgi:hypothetical protein